MGGRLDKLTAEEARKYDRVWRESGNYRHQCDGEPVVDHAFEVMGCAPGETLIDWGCGTGIAAQKFKNRGLDVLGFDISPNCLNDDIEVPLVVGVLWDPPRDLFAQYAFCTDVLEHLPPERIGASIEAISARTNKSAYFQVDTVADISGRLMRPPEVLHLTIKPGNWWEAQLSQSFGSVLPRKGTYSRIGFLCGYPLRTL